MYTAGWGGQCGVLPDSQPEVAVGLCRAPSMWQGSLFPQEAVRSDGSSILDSTAKESFQTLVS